MKNSKVLMFTAIIYLAMALFISSCKKGCMDVMATNYNRNVKSDNGSCEFAYTPFLGTYNMNDTLHSYSGPYYNQNIIVITKHNESGQKINILLHNGALLEANISGKTFTIPSQNAGGTIYYGDGSVSGNTLHLLYHIFDDEYVVSSGQRQ